VVVLLLNRNPTKKGLIVSKPSSILVENFIKENEYDEETCELLLDDGDYLFVWHGEFFIMTVEDGLVTKHKDGILNVTLEQFDWYEEEHDICPFDSEGLTREQTEKFSREWLVNYLQGKDVLAMDEGLVKNLSTTFIYWTMKDPPIRDFCFELGKRPWEMAHCRFFLTAIQQGVYPWDFVPKA